MNKKLILPISLILLVGLVGFAYATMTPSVPLIEGNYNIEISINKGWNLVPTTPILGIYQGDDYADDVISSDSTIKRDSLKAVYYYDRNRDKYLQVYPNAQEFVDYENSLAQEDEAYYRISSVWLYSDKEGVLKYSRVGVPKYNEVALEDGWNFLTIVPDMKGLRINDIKGSCDILKICDYARQNWDCINK